MAADLTGIDIAFIDSHVHLDHLYRHQPERIGWMRKKKCFPISWSFALQAGSVSELRNYLKSKADTMRELDRCQLPCRFLAGIHPRNMVSGLKPESVRDLLMPYLEMDLCLGVGEIGLETASTQEIEVLHAHLELRREVAELDKVFGIHTPRRNKSAVTRQTLDLLKPCKDYGDRIVVDHCMPETISEVLSAGFWAGVTLSPAKAGDSDMKTIIDHHAPDLSGIMVNTDSGAGFFEDLFQFAQAPAIDMETRRGLTRFNAARFFRLTGVALEV